MAGDNEKGKKGFSGLIDLTSDFSEVDDRVESEPASEEKPSTATQASPSTPKATPRSEPERKSTTSHSPVETVSSGKSAGGSGWKWILGVVAVIFVIWLANHGGQNSKKTSYNPPPSTRTYNFPQSNPADVMTPSTSRGSGQLYEKPPVGTNNVHSVPQIRRCVRERIRIETMRDLIDPNEGIDEFNKIVADYNRRCRYARTLGHAYQPASRTGSNRKSTGNTPKRPNAQLTREAQKLLTELGYEPGPIDGQYGRRTASAIKAFQLDNGLIPDGKIDKSLLKTLEKSININRFHAKKPITSLRYRAQLTKRVQKILTELGYDPGPIDGQYGRRTASAIKAFQLDNGLMPDGKIDKSLLKTLEKSININQSTDQST
jgi:peptidoglycan hydrolase-like protein with peptidoglycan-binding domain